VVKASDRENLAWEGVILMTCRPTKRGDELRKVVLLKSSSKLRHESTYHCGNAVEAIRELVDSSRKQGKALLRRKSWEGVSIKILQNLTAIGRSLSGETGNRVIVPKGVMQTISQG